MSCLRTERWWQCRRMARCGWASYIAWKGRVEGGSALRTCFCCCLGQLLLLLVRALLLVVQDWCMLHGAVNKELNKAVFRAVLQRGR